MRTLLVLLSLTTYFFSSPAKAQSQGSFYVNCQTRVPRSACGKGIVSVQLKRHCYQTDCTSRFIIDNGDLRCDPFPQKHKSVVFNGEFAEEMTAIDYRGLGHRQFGLNSTDPGVKANVIIDSFSKTALLRMNTLTPSGAEAVYNLQCSTLGGI